jgi:hypothetical protein
MDETKALWMKKHPPGCLKEDKEYEEERVETERNLKTTSSRRKSNTVSARCDWDRGQQRAKGKSSSIGIQNQIDVKKRGRVLFR